MALSLVCKQCNHPLRSVAEVQEHGEVTGHSQFEESREAVSIMDAACFHLASRTTPCAIRTIFCAGAQPCMCSLCQALPLRN